MYVRFGNWAYAIGDKSITRFWDKGWRCGVWFRRRIGRRLITIIQCHYEGAASDRAAAWLASVKD